MPLETNHKRDDRRGGGALGVELDGHAVVQLLLPAAVPPRRKSEIALRALAVGTKPDAFRRSGCPEQA